MYKQNYKKTCGLTLKNGKELCKNILGRLPKCGYEVCILSGYNESNHFWKVYLQNISGSYSMYKWTSVNPG